MMTLRLDFRTRAVQLLAQKYHIHTGEKHAEKTFLFARLGKFDFIRLR
jgi:hypothetical protein